MKKGTNLPESKALRYVTILINGLLFLIDFLLVYFVWFRLLPPIGGALETDPVLDPGVWRHLAAHLFDQGNHQAVCHPRFPRHADLRPPAALSIPAADLLLPVPFLLPPFCYSPPDPARRSFHPEGPVIG